MITKCANAFLVFIVAVSTLLIVSHNTIESTDLGLNENLKLLEPLVNTRWVGEIKALDDGRYLEVVRQFDVIWDGTAVRITSYCRELNVEREGYIYWDALESKIKLFSINNRGVVQVGRISQEPGRVLFSGIISFPDRSLEFKNSFEPTQDGKLLDKWFRFENGAWLAGHEIELRASQ